MSDRPLDIVTRNHRRRAASLLGAVMAVLFLPCWAFAQVQFSLGTASGSPGGTVSLPLSISGGDTSAYAGFQMEFTIPSGLSLSSVTQAEALGGFVTEIYTFDNGGQSMGGFIAYSGNRSFGADSELASLDFVLDSSATAGDRTLSIAESWLSDVTGAALAAHAVTSGVISIGTGGEGEGEGECGAEPPTQVQATDGTLTDRVQITWDAVANATEYEVYRATTNNSSSAALLTTTAATMFDDTTAEAPSTVTGTGCPAPAPTTDFVRYYYWVRSVLDCGTSDFGTPDQGYRGEESASKELLLYIAVLPNETLDSGLIAIAPDAPLSLRVHADGIIDHTRAWADLASDVPTPYSVHWQPVGLNDGWIVITPDTSWTVGDTITATGGAPMMDGTEALTPLFEFTVMPDAFGEQTQPMDGNSIVYPPNADGVFTVDPLEAYATPMTVSIPVPPGEDGGALVPWLWLPDSETWHPGSQVTGWLLDDSLEQTTLNGQVYLRFRVRHGGTVSLQRVHQTNAGTQSASVLPAPFGKNQSLPTILLYAALLGALLLARYWVRLKRV